MSKEFLKANYQELEALLNIVNTDWRYGRNWTWLLEWCDCEISIPQGFTVDRVIQMFKNDSTWVAWDKN